MASLADEPWLQALVARNASMPARTIRPSRFSITGYVPTAKASRSQDAESALEHDFLTLLDYDDTVERFVAQPFTIRWTDQDGKRRRYTPDVAVKYSFSAHQADPGLRITIYEVKPREILLRDWETLKPIFRAAIGWALGVGARFHIVTDSEIRTPYLDNVRFLMGYRSHVLREVPAIAGQRQWLIRRALYEAKRSTPRDLLELVTTEPSLQAQLIPWVWNLVNCRSIGVDLSKPLTMVSPIWTLETEHTMGDQ